MSITKAQAVVLLEYVLYETPAAAQANAAHWVTLSQTVAADSTITGAATAMASTAEVGIAEQVIRYYEGALARTPAASEIAYYGTIAEAGVSATQLAQGPAAVSQAVWNVIASDFINSPEFQFASAGSGLIPQLYQNILGRPPSSSETAFYAAQQAAGYGSDLLLQEFVNSPEYQNRINPVLKQDLIVFGSQVASGQVSPGTSIPIDAVTKSGDIGLVGIHAQHISAAPV